MHNASILIADDNPGVLSAGKLFLKRHFSEVETIRDPEEIPALLSERRFDVVMLDMNFSRTKNTGEEGLFWLEKILEIDPTMVVVMVTAYGDVQLAVQAIRKGAADFVLKPWDNEKLLATLQAALRLKNSQDEAQNLKTKQTGSNLARARDLPELIWRSKAMEQVMNTIERVAQTDANVLLLGENGTGKDLIAQAIHAHSDRASENFVKVDLGALTDSLFESELFGHVKGAFTDAREDRPGRFEAADGGVIFLDEIGNLPLGLQSKLLTVLQNRTVTRVGANRAREVNVRVIAATNMDLYQMVKERSFRQDLLYRINTIEINIPALRERPEDIELLAGHFLEQFAQKYKRPVQRLSAALLKEMQRYPWPGNVRELRHAVERAVIMADGPTLDTGDFFFRDQSESAMGSDLPLMHLEEVEKHLISKALGKHYGNITEAAKELGITRASLYRRLEKHKL
ncbi:MAG: sigma-54-dependent Fis family transcriptional regulator [Saprospiraceae bacterium]|nr:sigma-54-dependent Fis family transcriptional regulator [Saprospiraceae bacterium]